MEARDEMKACPRFLRLILSTKTSSLEIFDEGISGYLQEGK